MKRGLRIIVACGAAISLFACALVVRLWQVSYLPPTVEKPFVGVQSWIRASSGLYVWTSQRGWFTVEQTDAGSLSDFRKPVPEQTVLRFPYALAFAVTAMPPAIWLLPRLRTYARRRSGGRGFDIIGSGSVTGPAAREIQKPGADGISVPPKRAHD